MYLRGAGGHTSQGISHRIPALLKTQKGTLIAARISAACMRQTGGYIGTVIRRSTDDMGQTWGPGIDCQFGAQSQSNGSESGSPVTIDVAMVCD